MRNENPRISSFTATVIFLTILCTVVQKLPAQTKDVNQKSKSGNEAMKMTETQNCRSTLLFVRKRAHKSHNIRVKCCSKLGFLHPQGRKRSTVMPEQNHPTYDRQNRQLCLAVMHRHVVDDYVGDHWAAQRNRQGNVPPNQKQRSADDLHRTRKPHIV